MRRIHLLGLAAALCLVGCHENTDGTSGGSSGSTGSVTQRCEFDLAPWLDTDVSGASAHVIADASELIGGEAANGRLGDVLLANDKIRVIVQQPGREIGPDPFGGALIDADLVHPGPGNDKFGKLAPFFNFGRTVNVDKVEVLASGDQGGPAIVAASGTDTVNDFINVNNQIDQLLSGQKLAIDTEAALDLRITTYYWLLPGQSHVSVVTAFCNDSTQTTQLITAGDLIDSGGDVALFDPQSSTKGLGYGSLPDPMSWLGWLASDNSIAYGVAPWKLNDLSTPSTQNNSLTVAGVTGYIIGNQGGIAGLTEWLNPDARNRSGTLIVPAADKNSGAPGQVIIGREFAVGRDMAAVAQELEAVRAEKSGAALGGYGGTVSDSSGPVEGARVVAERPDISGSGTMREAIFVTDATGHFAAQLPKDSYTFTAYAPGHAVSASVDVASDATNTSDLALTVGDGHTLTVTATDASTRTPIPAKLVVRCNGACATPPAKLVRFEDYQDDTRPDDIQLIAFIPPSGTLSVPLPAGQYQVMVTHGPEDSIWPLTAPAQGFAVDLTTSDASVSAALAKVVDTSGWRSDDFHVHSVNSPDSPVSLDDRVKTFLAEDVNIITATDHDFLTDYAPTIAQLGGSGLMNSVISEEVTTFDYGHFNPWPRTRDESDPVTFGAIDWGNGTEPSLSIDQIIDKSRALGATTFQINHPNGKSSTFGAIGLDADTLVSHADPAKFRLPTSPNATAGDTGLFPRHKWDAMEVMNGFSRTSFDGLLNNWMTFTADGLVVTATAVSDTHKRWSSAGGYPRSYVMLPGHDTNATFDVDALSEQVNAHHVTGSLGLFIKAYAFKSGTAYSLATLEADCAAAGASCARVGDTLPIDANGLDVVVDVQSPEWIPFDEIDLFSHQAARWMLNGEPDENFAPDQPPAAGWSSWSGTAKLEPALNATTSSVDLGCGQASCIANRWHAQAVFHIDPASGKVPAGDDFFFAVARNANSSQDLMPLVYDGVLDSNGTIVEKPARAFAFTNAIFVDRDGSGYNHPPHVQDAAGASANRKPHPQVRHTGSLEDRIREALHQIAIER